MPYLGNGLTKFTTADDLTVSGDATIDTTTLVVDSTNNRVGVKVAPERDLHVKGSSGDPVHFKLEGDASDYARIMFDDGTDDNIGEIRYDFGSDFMQFTANAAERMRLTSAGLLGLGTSSPADTNSFGNALDIQSATGAGLYLRESDATSNYGLVAADQSRLYLHHQGEVVVRTGGANTRMTIDSSGNLLVGKTSDTFASNGTALKSTGEVNMTRTDAVPLSLRRNGTTGNLIEFYDDSATVGAIGNSGTDFHIRCASGGGTDAGIALQNNDRMNPLRNGALSDGTIDIGYSNYRWRNLYLSGGAYIGGTGSANYLDDYEEGTFNPALGSNETFTSRYGKYVKVGNVVHIQLRMVVNQINNGSTYQISGLPFTSANLGHHQTGCAGYSSNLATSNYFVGVYMNGNGTTLNVIGKSAQSPHVYNNMPVFQNSADIAIAISYVVS